MSESGKASTELLEALHKAVANSLTKRIEEDTNEGIPTDAATLGAAIRFLRDNEITADPSTNGDIERLRERLREQAKIRQRHRGSNIVSLAEDELKSSEG